MDDEELRRLLASDGILHATPAQPIRHLSGAPAPWAFYSWGATLTERGLRLAGEALVERLSRFHSTQVAAYGQTAQPLLGAIVLLGEGRYTGLSIRKQRKASVTGRQVDGPLDRSRSVAIVDDSIVSGMSLEAAIRALEGDGFEVEGVVALVRFPHRGGIAWAWANGYRVDTLFDIWTDLGMAAPPFRPDEGFPPGTRSHGSRARRAVTGAGREMDGGFLPQAGQTAAAAGYSRPRLRGAGRRIRELPASSR